MNAQAKLENYKSSIPMWEITYEIVGENDKGSDIYPAKTAEMAVELLTMKRKHWKLATNVLKVALWTPSA